MSESLPPQFVQALSTTLALLARAKETFLVAVDGGGGSGKTSLCRDLQALDARVSLVHMDDFLRPKVVHGKLPLPGEGYYSDWQRLKESVILPLSQGKGASYRRYDWFTDDLQNTLQIEAGGIVIVEGVFSLCAPLLEYYDFKIWLDCPQQIRLARGIARDGADSQTFWQEFWIPAEKSYISKEEPYKKADLIVQSN